MRLPNQSEIKTRLGCSEFFCSPYNPPKKMKTEAIVRLMAGAMILISLALFHWHHSNWIWLTAFIGFALFQSAITGICPSAIVIRKLRGETATGS